MDNLVSSQMGKLINTCSITSLVALPMESFEPTLLEAIVPIPLRDRLKPTIHGDVPALMEKNMLVEKPKQI